MEMNDVVFKIILPIILVLLTHFLTRYRERTKNRVKLLEYAVVKSSNLFADIAGLEINIDKKPIANMGVLQLVILNRTDTNFKNLRLDIKFAYPNDPERVINLLRPKFKDDFNNLKIINLDEQHVLNLMPIVLAVANSGKKPILEMSSAFEDIEHVDIEVSVREAGFEMKKIKLYEEKKPTSSFFGWQLGIILFCIGFVVGMVNYAKVQERTLHSSQQHLDGVQQTLDSLQHRLDTLKIRHKLLMERVDSSSTRRKP